MVWKHHIAKVIEEIGFIHSRVEDCILYWHGVIFVLYVDYGISTSPNKAAINQSIMEIVAKFDMEDQGTLDN